MTKLLYINILRHNLFVNALKPDVKINNISEYQTREISGVVGYRLIGLCAYLYFTMF